MRSPKNEKPKMQNVWENLAKIKHLHSSLNNFEKMQSNPYTCYKYYATTAVLIFCSSSRIHSGVKKT